MQWLRYCSHCTQPVKGLAIRTTPRPRAVDLILNWAQSSSLIPADFNLYACCRALCCLRPFGNYITKSLRFDHHIHCPSMLLDQIRKITDIRKEFLYFSKFTSKCSAEIILFLLRTSDTSELLKPKQWWCSDAAPPLSEAQDRSISSRLGVHLLPSLPANVSYAEFLISFSIFSILCIEMCYSSPFFVQVYNVCVRTVVHKMQCCRASLAAGAASVLNPASEALL